MHFDKGFPFTFKEILIRPGKSVRDVVSHLAYSALIIGFFMAVWTKIFFYKKGYNIFETFVLLSYIFGVFFISLLIFLLISKVTGLLIITKVGVFVLQGYFVAAIGQFFGDRKFLNYIKGLICLFLGVLTYKYALILLAYLIHIF